MHAITITENNGYAFEGEWGGIHGKVWRHERKRELLLLNYNLKIQ